MSRPPPKSLGPYEIVESLGSGGMGEVYLARDTRLGRRVAVKVPSGRWVEDDDTRRRMLQEARLASKLNHPNVCVIHDVGGDDGTGSGPGEPYIVMEYVEGRALAKLIDLEGLPPETVARYGVQIAGGLCHAHEHGVIHRDLKSTNVIVAPEGRTKILDFGLAVAGPLFGEAIDTRSTLIDPDSETPSGTLAYMAPEVLRGSRADARTDLWSFGVLLYEMAAGTLPFTGNSGFELCSSILRDSPRPLPARVPGALRAVIARLLTKEREQRYQQAAEVRAALETLQEGLLHEGTTPGMGQAAPWGPTTAPRSPRAGGSAPSPGAGEPPSIAVLPFLNVSPDPGNAYFSDGLAEELISALSKLERLRVASRTSAFRFRDSDLDIRQIGERLGVASVLEGSVRKAGDRLRISAQLVDVGDGYQIWSETWDRSMEDVFAIQEEIARSIVDKLKVRLVDRGDLIAPPTRSLEAYNLFLKGRYFWNRRTDDDFLKARNAFEGAVREDPRYARAYAGLADSYALLGIAEYGVLPPQQAMPRAKKAALEALEIQPGLADALTAVAHVEAFYDWDRERAEATFRKAMEADPSYPFAHHWYACMLATMERHDEAVAEELAARERDPLSLIINKNVGTVLYYARRYDEAIAEYERALDLDPDFVRTLLYLGIACEQVGRHEEALGHLERAVRRSGRNAVCLTALGHARATAGKADRARDILQELHTTAEDGYVPALGFALLHLGLGEADAALDFLEQAYDERSSWMLSLRCDPWFDPLRSDPRFRELVDRVGWPRATGNA